MIIPILAVVAILTYLAWIRIEPLAWRVPLGLISGTVFVALVMLLLVNFDRHYGMEKVTKTETHQIYSAVGDKNKNGNVPIATNVKPVIVKRLAPMRS